ncbi:MAG: peptidase M56 BlaR1 [Clostridiales bacterium GWF2_38_85]|nr:MAG: peptidase M56 BlaR1 [Clostridiales bacterium GWF2_38_85]HBL83457.1 peptidase M56 BlaR1 [Clostridiales bacterium]
MSGVFFWVLNMSIIGGAAGIFILLLRKIRAIPRSVICYLWAIPFIRFTIPFIIESRFSIMNLVAKYAIKTVVVYEPVAFPIITMTNMLQTAERYFPIVYKTSLLENIFNIAATVWIIGFCAAFLTQLFLYITTMAAIKDSVHIRDNIYISKKIDSPAVYGIFRPKIILPQNVNESDMEFIFLHENTHIRRLDNLVRFIAVLTACLHWFNPITWICLKYFLIDNEIACDERVLKHCGEEKRKSYATAIFNCEAKRTIFVSTFGGAKTKIRIENILSYKQATVFSTVCFIAFAAAIAYILLTNAAV